MNSGTRIAAGAALMVVCALVAGTACSSSDHAKKTPASSARSEASGPAVATQEPEQPVVPRVAEKPAQPAAPSPPTAPSAPTVPTAPEAPKPETKELATGVRINIVDKYVEFDAMVPLNAKAPDKSRIYLEVIACPPDTKEHEAVLLTKAKPSHVHAALLLLGLEPGSPGVWDWEGETLKAIPPTGPRLKVRALYTLDGRQVEVNPGDWVIDANTRKTLTETAGKDHWVFAGSQMYKRQGQEAYRADADGTLIGLTTFGGETIAWTGMYNPDSGIEEPHWIANAATLPDFQTPVVVRISRD